MKSRAIYLFKFVFYFFRNSYRCWRVGMKPVYFKYKVKTIHHNQGGRFSETTAVNIVNYLRENPSTLDELRQVIFEELRADLLKDGISPGVSELKRIGPVSFFCFCIRYFGTHSGLKWVYHNVEGTIR